MKKQVKQNELLKKRRDMESEIARALNALVNIRAGVEFPCKQWSDMTDEEKGSYRLDSDLKHCIAIMSDLLNS